MSKITILGIGADGINSLNKKGLQVLKQADIIFGSNRHLEMIDTNFSFLIFFSCKWIIK